MKAMRHGLAPGVMLVTGAALSGCAADGMGNAGVEKHAAIPHQAFARRMYEAWASGETMPQFTCAYPEANLADGYTVQQAFVRHMREDHGIGGYKAAVVVEVPGGDTEEAHTPAAGSQYATLLETVNNLIGRGYTIKPGHVITNGALGNIVPLETGMYRAPTTGRTRLAQPQNAEIVILRSAATKNLYARSR